MQEVIWRRPVAEFFMGNNPQLRMRSIVSGIGVHLLGAINKSALCRVASLSVAVGLVIKGTSGT